MCDTRDRTEQDDRAGLGENRAANAGPQDEGCDDDVRDDRPRDLAPSEHDLARAEVERRLKELWLATQRANETAPLVPEWTPGERLLDRLRQVEGQLEHAESYLYDREGVPRLEPSGGETLHIAAGVRDALLCLAEAVKDAQKLVSEAAQPSA
jgi:hypothetical protein